MAADDALAPADPPDESADSAPPTDATDPGPRPGRSTRHLALVLGVAAAVVALDQLTKWWALEALRTRTIHVVWTLQLNLVRNPGTAFSIIKSGGQFIGPIAVLVVLGLIWQGRSVSTRLGAIALGLALGGAIGNLLDRALRSDAGFMQGRVIDFVDLQWYPVFNVADAALVIGLIMLAVVYVFGADEGLR